MNTFPSSVFKGLRESLKVAFSHIAGIASPYRRGERRACFSVCLCLLVGFQSLVLSATTNGQPTGAPVLTQAAQVHDLPPGSITAMRLHLVGKITYYDSADAVMFFQDMSGGVYINTDKAYPVRTGDLVEVDGWTHDSFRTEVAMDPTIRVLGRGGNLPAPTYSYAQLAAGQGDSTLVTVRGLVRAQDVEQHQNAPSVHLDLIMEGGGGEVYLDHSFGTHPPSMLDAEVELTGVAGGAFDEKDQMTGIVLYVPEPSALRILKPPSVRLDQLPVTDIDNVFPFLRDEDKSDRVRVHGTVTYYKKGDSVVLESHGKSIYVQTRQTTDLEPGDVVDAYGFASDRDYAPSLRQASIVKTGEKAPVTARAITYEEAFSGIFSDNLVSLTGKLVSQLHTPDSDTLVIDVSGHIVRGTLRRGTPIPTYLLGSTMRLTGICRVVPGGPFRAPSIFHIDMRDAGDATVLARPSWWTVRHLLVLLAVLLALATATALWAFLLRRRLVFQSARIERSMVVARERSQILEKISSNLPPDALLSTICASVAKLLPGTECSYSFDPSSPLASKQELEQVVEGRRRLFEVALTGDGDEPIGWIVVSENDGCIPAEDRQEVYELLAETARLAIRQLLLHQALVHRSTHDALTELPNRWLCDIRLGNALEEAKAHGNGLAVVYVDVDRFKDVNDLHGHRIGDLYLREISARLLAVTRSTDTLARIGGDEFLLILPFASPFENSEALRSRFESCFEEPFVIEGRVIDGSASLGVAEYPEHGLDAEALKIHADHAMYQTKRSKTSI